jgi:hypothetical protein
VSWQQRGAVRTAAIYRVQAVVAGLPSRHLISMALCGPEAVPMDEDFLLIVRRGGTPSLRRHRQASSQGRPGHVYVMDMPMVG